VSTAEFKNQFFKMPNQKRGTTVKY